MDFKASKIEPYNLIFTMKELLSTLYKYKESAPGPDDISYSLLKNSSKDLKLFLLELINRIWKENTYPTLWKTVFVLPFLKPGKESKFPINYRPIALTSCISKLMEKMVNERLMWYLETKGYISPTQCGFQRMYSTTDVLIHLEATICEAFASNQHLITVFFDLEKAYDTTWRKLTWESHLKNLKNKCLKALEILKVISHTNWGADRTCLLQLHKALVLPKLLYGCKVYSSATKPRHEILNPIHHAGIRYATGAFRSSPINSLLVEAGELPLQIHPKSIKPFGFRVKSLVEDHEINQCKVLPHKYSAVPPWRLIKVEYCQIPMCNKNDLPDDVIRTEFLNHVEEHKGFNKVFTDGSKSDAGTGFGVVFKDLYRYGALPEASSIFTAELHAILSAIKYIIPLEGEKFVILSDSQSALQALEVFNPVHPLQSLEELISHETDVLLYYIIKMFMYCKSLHSPNSFSEVLTKLNILCPNVISSPV
ncbi:uncharacterized protein LOC143026095 [Oratosquilla oratoria]|uniref:uncharacterized protein LOC143026095 n=1 Tax=Oratosquilla oratoria TaxID=337810 RepID=UPI003F768C66